MQNDQDSVYQRHTARQVEVYETEIQNIIYAKKEEHKFHSKKAKYSIDP